MHRLGDAASEYFKRENLQVTLREVRLCTKNTNECGEALATACWRARPGWNTGHVSRLKPGEAPNTIPFQLFVAYEALVYACVCELCCLCAAQTQPSSRAWGHALACGRCSSLQNALACGGAQVPVQHLDSTVNDIANIALQCLCSVLHAWSLAVHTRAVHLVAEALAGWDAQVLIQLLVQLKP